MRANLINVIRLLCEAFWHAVYALAVAALSVGRLLDTVLALLRTRTNGEPVEFSRSATAGERLVSTSEAPEISGLGFAELSAEGICHVALHGNAGVPAFRHVALGKFSSELAGQGR